MFDVTHQCICLNKLEVQTYGKLFSKFKFVFELMAENRKNSNEKRGVNVEQSAMC